MTPDQIDRLRRRDAMRLPLVPPWQAAAAKGLAVLAVLLVVFLALHWH